MLLSAITPGLGFIRHTENEGSHACIVRSQRASVPNLRNNQSHERGPARAIPVFGVTALTLATWTFAAAAIAQLI